MTNSNQKSSVAPIGLAQLANAVFLGATDVPEAIRSYLPSKMAPVSTLLKTNIPTRLLETMSIIRPVHLCTSPLDPSWAIDELFSTSLSSRAWLYTLEENLGQMWTSRTHSIEPPTSSSPSLRLPLWVANFWNMAVEVVEQSDQ